VVVGVEVVFWLVVFVRIVVDPPVVVDEARHLPTNVTLVVKLLGAVPTAYCWKVTTPDELVAPHVDEREAFTPKAVKDLCWQHWPLVVQPLLEEHAVPALAVTREGVLHVQVWLRPPKSTL
jgi:hypothetical protein